MTIIDCCSDLHGFYPKLEGGDLLIVAGDLTASDQTFQYFNFFWWLAQQGYKKKVFIAGNHDNKLEEGSIPKGDFEYLCDSGTEFEGLKIWGSPWTKTFEGMNPHCKAFTVDTEEELAEKWDIIPENIDILITHGPPYGLGDKTVNGDHVGSMELGIKVGRMKPLKVWVWGHIHESYGEQKSRSGCILINASHVNERYEPINKPIRIEL